ncbi:MAG: 3-hexulose-6-phosphate synthase [Methanobacteriota archaeon]
MEEAGRPRVVLQVALDEMNLHRAVEIGREAVAGGVDWVEAGTPLVKSEGMNAIRELKRAFPDRTIVADLKTMDTGSLETEMACKAGASVVGILGVSDDGTIREAAQAARRYGAKVYVDLIGAENPAQRAKQAEALGADYVSIHVGVDAQMKGRSPVELVRAVASATALPVAGAGGLTSATVADGVKAGAAIVIVGGAITKAKDVTSAARRIRTALDELKVIESPGFKKFDEARIREAFNVASTPNISDAMHHGGAMHGLSPLDRGYKMIGPALTVRTMDGDWAKPVEAIDQAAAGDVLVIDAGSGTTAVWGELATHSCVEKKLAGVVIDGAIRDVDEIRRLKFPAYARNVVPNAGDPKGFGEIGIEVVVGGQKVRTGDWIVGDESGLVVVPREVVVEMANRGLDVKEREDRIREEIDRGSTLSKVLRLKLWEKVIG